MSDKTTAVVSVLVLIAGAFHLTSVFGVDELTNFLNLAFAFFGAIFSLYHTYKAHGQIAGLKQSLGMNAENVKSSV